MSLPDMLPNLFCLDGLCMHALQHICTSLHDRVAIHKVQYINKSNLSISVDQDSVNYNAACQVHRPG